MNNGASNEYKRKKIEYLYASQEEYRSGKKPYMIYMDGIDGRTGHSGIFRLNGDSYVDNSTFRKENGEYKIDTISYEEIMKLAGKMPTQLSQEANSVAMTGKYKMRPEIQEIFNKALQTEKNADKDVHEVDEQQL